MRILVIGNCQAQALAECLGLMVPNGEVHSVHIVVQPIPDGRWDVLLLQTELRDLVGSGGALSGIEAGQILTWPTFYFPGYHPDIVYAYVGDQIIQSPVGYYNSSIIIHAYKEGINADQTEKFFCEDTFRQLGFFE